MTKTDNLRFIVAPHIVQDLGLNLYTSLPRVIVEFVANAYDADASKVSINYDKEGIDQERKVLKKQFELEMTMQNGNETVKPLHERHLPVDFKIVIKDDGVGMSRVDLQEKFLVAGRRRRELEESATTGGGRALMGRKGLGKLAGFGVCKSVEVTSCRKTDEFATRITLNYGDLIKVKDTNEIEIPTVQVSRDGIDESGTTIVLSQLLYEPLKSRAKTIGSQIADHFALIDPSDFKIELNNDVVKPTEREFDYAWPEPSKPIQEFVQHTFETELGEEFSFNYRIRFTKKRQALRASDRGIRVYSHKRLAAAPSLLDADTNMHGFRMVDYMDGVVHADFIDEQQTDYVATDRQGLRWDTPLLNPMYEFLSDQIKEACKMCQKKREEDAPNEVKQDEFTNKLIEELDLASNDKRLAEKIATAFAANLKKGVEDPDYKEQLPLFLNAIGQRDILKAISELAKHKKPALANLAAEVARLTDSELDDTLKYVKARIDAIAALKKICEDQDFKKAKNEKELHALFKKSPWLIDPQMHQFLSSDVSMNSMLDKIGQELKIDSHAGVPNENDDTRPDLVFLLGNEGLAKVIIVELKAPNVPLESKHLDQLLMYMRKTRKYIEDRNKKVVVEGYLIGELAPSTSKANGVELLREKMETAGNREDWKIYSIQSVLERTENAHNELLRIQRKARSGNLGI